MIKKFTTILAQLKNNTKSFKMLILLDLFLVTGSTLVDWHWLSSVKWYLLPFAPICSLYPLLLVVWLILYRLKKNIPPFLTSFIFIAIAAYGPMAWVYFPSYMVWYGFDWIIFGNIFWVTAYALQAFVIKTEIKPLPAYQYFIIIAYFLFKDYADFYLGSFWDIVNDYPSTLKYLLLVSMLSLQLLAIMVCLNAAFPHVFRWLRSHLKSVH